jgi:N-acetylneuraminic acid mutarotase
MRWSVHVEGGPRRVNHASVSIGDKIFSFGGFCTGDNYKEKKPIDVFVLNTFTYRWTHLKNQNSSDKDVWPFQRYGHTVASYEEDIYLFGGRNDRTPCNCLYKFSTNTLKWSKPKVTGDVPGKRDGHSACVIGKYMFVFGGYEDAVERFAQEVFRLDLETMHWELMECNGQPPIHRDFHSATPVGKNMYIFGGRSTLSAHGFDMGQDVYSHKVCYLDTVTFTWHMPRIQTPAPAGRRSHSALSINNNILIFGGYNGRSEKHMNDLWSLDTESMSWTHLEPRGTPPTPRRRHAMCLVKNRIFVFGGTSPHEGPPLYFTEDQLALLPPQQEEEHSGLMDHNDLHVLDINPSLRTLCILQIVNNRISTQDLPATILAEMNNMLSCDVISKPLRTVDSLTSG